MENNQYTFDRAVQISYPAFQYLCYQYNCTGKFTEGTRADFLGIDGYLGSLPIQFKLSQNNKVHLELYKIRNDNAEIGRDIKNQLSTLIFYDISANRFTLIDFPKAREIVTKYFTKNLTLLEIQRLQEAKVKYRTYFINNNITYVTQYEQNMVKVCARFSLSDFPQLQIVSIQLDNDESIMDKNTWRKHENDYSL